MLQPLMWPSDGNEEVLLYIKTNGCIKRDGEKTYMILEQGNTCKFNTYFNSFSAGKWKKYTVVERIWVDIAVLGLVKIRLFYLRSGMDEQLLEQLEWRGNGQMTELPCSFVLPSEGILYLELEAVGNGVELYDYDYHTMLEDERLKKVNLSAVICTYRREQYVEHNLREIETEILENERSPLFGKLSVFVADNGQTLNLRVMPQIKVEPNRNLGGVGGFTRGMIETLENKDFEASHIILMDDDAIIKPHVLEKTYRFLSVLRQEYSDYTVAGALLRQDIPYIQFESGARWNRGNIKALKNQLDLRNVGDVTWNEYEDEMIEYAGWWYSCIPVAVIKKIGLPLPLFIHRDDIEYGLRMEGRFITLNGIGIWHEPYLNKMPGVLEYYDLRNLAIVNSIHYPDYKVRELQMMLIKWGMGNILRYRYQYIKFNLQGIDDFCKGYQWFEDLNGETYHDGLRKKNYKLVKKETLYGYRGLQEADFQIVDKIDNDVNKSRIEKMKCLLTLNGSFFPGKKCRMILLRPYGNIYQLYRQKEAIYADTEGMCLLVQRNMKSMIKCCWKLLLALLSLERNFAGAKQSYHDNAEKLMSVTAWRRRLNLDDTEN